MTNLDDLGGGSPPPIGALDFCRTPLEYSGHIEQPGPDVIKGTFGLWNASLDDAIKYGGELTRAAIFAAKIRHDRKYVIVDTKIHQLMPGMSPAIPGWHTDGTPRGHSLDPQAKSPPNIWAQEAMRAPRFHLLVTGAGCLTEFCVEPVRLMIPKDPNSNLFETIDKQMKINKPKTALIESCRIAEWDWWSLHTSTVAKNHEWRFLLRITETDYQPPESDLRKIIRNQQNVYVPQSFGW